MIWQDVSRTMVVALLVFMASSRAAPGQEQGAPEPAKKPAAESSVTIYNGFATVRQTVPMNLHQGLNTVSFADITAQADPESVTLRDPEGKRRLAIREQNYRNDPLSEGLLLSLFEGETIQFRVTENNQTKVVPGKIIRSGYVPGSAYALGQIPVPEFDRWGRPYTPAIPAPGDTPIVEMNDGIRFGLPGQPLFPSLKDDTILKPTMHWVIDTDAAGPVNAELSYLTDGMDWHADYNFISPEKEEIAAITGWITLSNTTGKQFTDARIKVIAGDVRRVTRPRYDRQMVSQSLSAAAGGMQPGAAEKTFDEYHLYTLTHPATIRGNETKQVEFVRASNVRTTRTYTYDAMFDSDQQIQQYWRFSGQPIAEQRLGASANTKVRIWREAANTEEDGLGIPLPKGAIRFYRRDDDGRVEFVGSNTIDHTPKNEPIRVPTGNAFDLVGEHKQTDFKYDATGKTITESFEIRLRNRKEAPVTITAVEHLFRWNNWEIIEKSQEFKKVDARTIEFPAEVPADGEKVITYTVKYTW
ncbi:MAG: hypothetical protein HY719_14045 [Planctomycetes bacterium]|nr:hypothetical protein [Planctomycetota bacterium]